MILALIPAAGQSRRMGRPKLALPWGERTVLEHVVHTLRQGGVEQVLVVVGPHVPELVPLAQSAGAGTLLLAQPTADMRATVQAGLRWLEAQFQPRPTDVWLLVPADHPTLAAGVVRQLLEAHSAMDPHSVIVPTFQGRRGHPVLLRWEHVPHLLSLPAEQGVNHYLRQCAELTRELPLTTADILHDLDTPEDYERLRRPRSE